MARDKTLENLKRDYGNVLWQGKKCIWGLPLSFTRYILTDTTLFTKVGLLNIREDEIELYRIMDKTISLPISQRIFRCGTVCIVSKDSDTPKKYLMSIKDPRRVKLILDKAIQQQRDLYLVRGRDMIGSNGSYSDSSDIYNSHDI